MARQIIARQIMVRQVHQAMAALVAPQHLEGTVADLAACRAMVVDRTMAAVEVATVAVPVVLRATAAAIRRVVIPPVAAAAIPVEVSPVGAILPAAEVIRAAVTQVVTTRKAERLCLLQNMAFVRVRAG
jgi:hypothetical protein